MVIGILAHVDAGKTTLSETILHKCKVISNLGRVDKGDSYLDNNEIEKKRGITIFSGQANVTWKDTDITIIDTPGHVDFSSEMERSLGVIDAAVLVISGTEGVQSHTETLWKLLELYGVPTFVFFNKMDRQGADIDSLMQQIKTKLSPDCIYFSKDNSEEIYEAVAATSEAVMEKYLEKGNVDVKDITQAISERKIFPCHKGSALKEEGIEDFLDTLTTYMNKKIYAKDFSARVFKITRDSKDMRLTHVKITGGSLKVKEMIGEEKVNEIRIYSGEKYESVPSVSAGCICTLVGLNETFAGQGLGAEESVIQPVLEPVLSYRVRINSGEDPAVLLLKLRILEEENPTLHINWIEELKEIYVQIMGEIQLQILKNVVANRFGADIDFDKGNVVYKETIKTEVEGVGHFEPLRHYAEAHVLLTPLERGAGIVVENGCSTDILAKNYQATCISCLSKRKHRGVLIGGELTDVKITLIGGKSHPKHTMGGDFREACNRAVRQGLMMTESILLEPYYEFELTVPTAMTGRAMTDLDKMYAKISPPEMDGDFVTIKGMGPVDTMRDYQKDVMAFTSGKGKIVCNYGGYHECHNQDEIIEKKNYDPETDTKNPTGSVFCKSGAGYYVPYDEVRDYMHIEILEDGSSNSLQNKVYTVTSNYHDEWIGTSEVDNILSLATGANKKASGKSNPFKKTKVIRDYSDNSSSKPKKTENRENYLLVDGYNVIFAWDDLKELARDNIDAARDRLLDVLSNYQGITNEKVMAIFDAYRVKNHATEVIDYHNIKVVFTKEAETADQFIEKFAHVNGRKHNVTVVTSDGLEQIIIVGQGCNLISSREFKLIVKQKNDELMENFNAKS